MFLPAGLGVVPAISAMVSVRNGSGCGREKRLCSVPEPSKNPTRSRLVVQTQPRTCYAAGFAPFGWTRQVQSPALHFGLLYLWSHSDILLSIVKD